MGTEIFDGKEKRHSEQVLILLFENGPLSAWGIVNKLTDKNKYSMNATINRRLKKLAEQKFVHKTGNTWLLTAKGMISAFIVEKEPKLWNSEWKKIFNRNSEAMTKNDVAELPFGLTNRNIKEQMEKSGLYLDDLETWKEFSIIAKKIIDSQIYNFTKINDKQLLALIVATAYDLDQQNKIIHPKNLGR